MTARGIRLNNPSNIRLNPNNKWLGEIPGGDPDFCTFDLMEHGTRALAYLLLEYQLHHQCYTLREIISRWAPSSENDTQSYIADVADRTGFDPDQNVDLKVPDNLTAVMEAICFHECGNDAMAVTQDNLDCGAELALRALKV